MRTVASSLDPEVLRAGALLAAAQHLPVALRRDGLARALANENLPSELARLRFVGDNVVVGSGIEGVITPQWAEFLATGEGWRSALERIAATTAPGDNQTRIAARAALPDIEPDLSAAMELVAANRLAMDDPLIAARDLDLAASLAPAADHGRILVAAAKALRQARLIEATLVALEEAEPLIVTPAIRAECLYLRGKAQVVVEDPFGGTATQVKAAEIYARIDPAMAAMVFLNASSSLLMTAESDRAKSLLMRARGLGPEEPTFAIACDVLEGRILQAQGRMAEAIPLLSLADSLARHFLADTAMEKLEQHVEHLLWVHLGSLMAQERWDELVTACEATIALAERFGSHEMAVYGLNCLGQSAWERGDYIRADAWLKKAEAAELGGATSWVTLVRLIEIGATGGDVEAAIDPTAGVGFEGPTMWTSYRALARALSSFNESRHDQVCDLLEPVLDATVAGGCRSFGGRTWLSMLVESQLATGARHAAEATAALQREWGVMSELKTLTIPAMRSQAMLADAALADGLWDDAVAAHEAWGNEVEIAQTLWARSEQILRMPEAGEKHLFVAADSIERAIYLFDKVGAKGMRTRCEAVRAAVLAKLGEIGAGQGLALSGREFEVVALVRDGFTNKEIASHLNVSVKTVEAHLRNVFRNNDVRNRVELVGRLTR